MNQRGSAAIWIMVLLVLVVSAGYVYLQKDIPLPVTEDTASNLIVGTWQSVDDLKSVVEYGGDGTTRDIYDGEELASSTWTITGGEQPILIVKFGIEDLKYTILDLNGAELILSYLPRGNILRYNRVTEEELSNTSDQAESTDM